MEVWGFWCNLNGVDFEGGGVGIMGVLTACCLESLELVGFVTERGDVGFVGVFLLSGDK